MPIFQYGPVETTQSSESDGLELRACCWFEYLHRSGESPLSRCPHCGKPVKKVPSLFSSQLSRQSKTSQALRASGKPHFAEAWEEASVARAKVPLRMSPDELAESMSGSESKSSAGKVLDSMKHHVCTASCSHGPLGRDLAANRSASQMKEPSGDGQSS